MPGKSWGADELKVLTQAVRAARSPSEIDINGRTPGAIRAMASRLNLVGDGIPRKRWPEKDLRTLQKLVAAGGTAKSIAAGSVLTGYGRNAIQKQMQRLGLGRAERSLPQKAAHRLSAAMMEAFLTFLSQHGKQQSIAWMTSTWNAAHSPAVSPQRVLYHLGRLGIRCESNSQPQARNARVVPSMIVSPPAAAARAPADASPRVAKPAAAPRPKSLGEAVRRSKLGSAGTAEPLATDLGNAPIAGVSERLAEAGAVEANMS